MGLLSGVAISFSFLAETGFQQGFLENSCYNSTLKFIRANQRELEAAWELAGRT
jgi:hypothetical protein